MSSEGDIKKLSDLRVVDLRTELEKRGLDKSGVKQTLFERLHKSLVDEGLNPETYNFELDKKPIRLSTSSRETEENVSEEQIVTTEKNETKIEIKSSNSEKNNNSDAPKEVVKVQEVAVKVKKIEESNSNTTVISKKVDNVIPDEIPISLTVEEEELETTESEKATTIPKLSDEKKNNDALGDEPTKEVDVTNTQQDAGKNEEIPTNGGSSVGKETSGKPMPSDGQNRNLWITNISQTTRATELKQALSEHGKVIGAKVVINARYPGACCYGYVKMETVADADNCIAKLNGTELNGQIIRIEKVRPDHLNPLKNAMRKPENDKTPGKVSQKSTEKKEVKADKPKDRKENNVEDKDKEEKKADKTDKNSKSENESKEKRSDSDRISAQKRTRRSRERIRRRSSSRERQERSLSSRSHRRERELLTFDKIKDERERERYRERERMIREEKRRREAAERQREIDRTRRSLESEREKLRIERERLERERAEIIQLERERQKLEREKLEIEKLELERVKLRIQEEERRSAKRPSSYRREDFEEKRRAAPDRHYTDAPPPPRFEAGQSVKPREPSPKKFGSSSGNKDYKARINYEKRDSYPPKRDRNYDTERSQSSISRSSSNINVFNIDRARDERDPRPRNNSSSLSNNNVQKGSNYTESRERVRERNLHFRLMRDERRPTNDHKTDLRSSRDHRYNENSKDNRSFERSNSNTWGHPSVDGKLFNASTAPPKVWAKDSWRTQESSSSSDRWNSTSSSRCGNTMSGAPFSNNSGMNLGPPPCPPPCPPPPGISNYVNDRFDYKNMRKY